MRKTTRFKQARTGYSDVPQYAVGVCACFSLSFFYGAVLISVRFPLFHGSVDVQLLEG